MKRGRLALAGTYKSCSSETMGCRPADVRGHYCIQLRQTRLGAKPLELATKLTILKH